MSGEQTVFVVDDDAAVGRALVSAGKVIGHPVRAFGSASEFLAAFTGEPGCLVLDIRMPGMSGTELQRHLADAGADVPIVMISGHADVRTAVEAMTLGAVTLLEKPFRLEDLIEHVRVALARDTQRRAARERTASASAKLAALTAKEREVLDLIAGGKSNREMADLLGLSVRAVEDRRSRLMKRVSAGSVAELVKLLAEAGAP